MDADVPAAGRRLVLEGRRQMSKIWYCPNCGYEVGARGRCHLCRQRLVASRLPELETGDEDDEVGYRLDDWADRERGRLIEWLNRVEILHRFEDDELVVAAEDEARVDDLVAELAANPGSGRPRRWPTAQRARWDEAADAAAPRGAEEDEAGRKRPATARRRRPPVAAGPDRYAGRRRRGRGVGDRVHGRRLLRGRRGDLGRRRAGDPPAAVGAGSR